MYKALTANEFCLYYQPIIDVNSTKIIGAEALVRWEHPQKGMVSPEHFIPIAEKSRFIHDLGKWVLFTACKQAKAWQINGFDAIIMSVNISARQLEAPNFVEDVDKILIETQLEGKWLQIEITESILVGNKESTTQTLLALKKMGIQISIDDFGTGYSSLSYIQKFPIDSLKIDQSFVKDIHYNSNNSIIPAIIEIGHSLQLRVVAEGVETEEQFNFLRKFGCDECQGYLFCHPVPNNLFADLLHSVQYLYS